MYLNEVRFAPKPESITGRAKCPTNLGPRRYDLQMHQEFKTWRFQKPRRLLRSDLHKVSARTLAFAEAHPSPKKLAIKLKYRCGADLGRMVPLIHTGRLIIADQIGGLVIVNWVLTEPRFSLSFCYHSWST